MPFTARGGRVEVSGFGIRGGRLRGGALILTSELNGVLLEEGMQGLTEIVPAELGEAVVPHGALLLAAEKLAAEGTG